MKLDRLLGILLVLLTKKRVNASYLANYFEVSRRTIYRDIESLELAGVPIATCHGRDGGIEILSSYKIDSHFLDENEKEILLDSLNLRSSLFEDKRIDLLIKKIENISNGNIQKQLLKSINILNLVTGRNEIRIDINNKLKLIKKAIDDDKIIKFNYTNYNGETKLRYVEPLYIRFNNGFWYLYGFCRVKNDFRVFKLTRIKDLKTTNDTFIPNRENLDNSIYTAYNKSHDIVILKFDRSELGKLYDYFTEDEIIEINSDSIVVEFKYYNDYNIISFILGFGSSVAIMQPIYLKQKLLYEVEKILIQNKNS